jgi:hypothetical protein
MPFNLNADFRRGCADWEISHLLLATRHFHAAVRELFYVSPACPVVLAAANLYSRPQYLVPSKKPQGGEQAIIRGNRGGPMADAASGLRKIHHLRTPVNKAFSDAAVFGRCHHAVCERWLVNQKRGRKESSSHVLRRKQADRAELTRST